MGLDEAVSFLGDGDGSQHDCERETEFFQFLFRQAEDQTGGDGRAGARETAERDAQSLDEADPYGVVWLDV